MIIAALIWMDLGQTVGGSEIRRSPVEVDSLSHYLQGFIHPRWCRFSEPLTVAPVCKRPLAALKRKLFQPLIFRGFQWLLVLGGNKKTLESKHMGFHES